MENQREATGEQPDQDEGLPPFKVVFDTVGFVRALIRPHGPWGRILFDHAEKYRIIVSEPLLTEIEDVLRRPTLITKFSGLPGRDVETVRRRLATGIFVRMLLIESVSRDPDDDYLIAMAVAGQASLVVTEDKDLLSIGDHRGVVFITGRSFIEYLTSL